MLSEEHVTAGCRVLAERRRRGWSARTAAQIAGISNTTWSAFERTDNLTDTIRQAVSDAFGWPATWPEQPVLTEPTAQEALIAAMDERIHSALAAADEDRQRIFDKLDEILAELKARP
jgi:hypothetical protein